MLIALLLLGFGAIVVLSLVTWLQDKRIKSADAIAMYLKREIDRKHEQHARDNDLYQQREASTRRRIAAAVDIIDYARTWEEIRGARAVLLNED